MAAIIWFSVVVEINNPMAMNALPKNNNPIYPEITGNNSGSP